MRVLITGAAGFLGSHLCDRFLAEGHEVVGMDNFSTGHPDNVAHLIGRQGFHFVEHNVTNFIYVQGPLDGVLHFASPASPVDYLEQPIPTLKVGSLGTHKTLGLAKAKGARYLLASTSEVYGDPHVHPQPETYWGHVNPVGPRGVYDEAKRFAEAMTMAYHRYHGLETRIVRIFNSIMADETVVLFNDRTAHVQPIEAYVDSCETSPVEVPRRVYVPAFNPATFRVELRLANALIKHPSLGKDAFRIRTRYGRHIRVTGDHSVFRRGPDGAPQAVPVRELRVGDDIAIPARLPVVEREVAEINLAEHLARHAASEAELWAYALVSPSLQAVVEERKEAILAYLLGSGRFAGSRDRRNSAGCAWRKYRRRGLLPLAVAAALWRRGLLEWPADAQLRPYKAGRGVGVCNRVELTSDLLWLLGLYLAEGTHVEKEGDYRLLLSSDARFLERAAAILTSHFGVRPRMLPPAPGRAPSLHVDSRVLLYLFDQVFGLVGSAKAARVPAWIMQLPLARVKHFLEGYREGDGTHTGYPEKRELAFNTASEALATDLTYLLLRFGIVASVGRYETTCKPHSGERRFPFWRVTVCEVSSFDLLSWDAGVEQTLNARRLGDLVWAKVRAIEPIEATPFVYDFSVEGFENFVAGSGVFAHNTYGPRMRPQDGRVVSNFIVQALRGEPLTIYGEGQQTRSFTYVDDLVEGIYRLFLSERAEPTNLGNPGEFTVRELAELVLEMTGSRSEPTFLPLPADDPRQRQPDITVARAVLGWEPQVPLREGLARTIPYFAEVLRRGGAGARTL